MLINKIRLHAKSTIYILLSILLVCWFSVGNVAAKSDKEGKQHKTKQTVAMSQKVYKKLQEAQEQVELKNYIGAHLALKKLREIKRLSSYEKAQAWNYTAYTYYLQEKYEDAINAYDEVLKEEDLPPALVQSVLKTKSQLYFVVADYESALVSIKQLMEVVGEANADLELLLGQAYFQLQDFDNALQPISNTINMYKEQGKYPKENWLLILRVIHYELEDYKKMVEVLKELIQLYPKDSYMMTLAAAYSQLGETKKQLAIMEVLYEKGYLKEPRQVINLANLFLLHGLPYKAAKVLEKEIEAERVEQNEKNLRLLSQAWQQARYDKKAIPPLKKAASLSDEGELYIRLAQLYINTGEWDKSAAALRKGISKGQLKRPDKAQVMLGMSLFNQKKFKSARSAFQLASNDKRSKSVAEQWITHINDEIKRQEIMHQEAFLQADSAESPSV